MDAAKPFYRAVQQGNLALAQKLYYNKPSHITNMVASNAFPIACNGGHLEIAQWLHDTFSIELNAIRGSFGMSCNFGCLHTAKWLVNTFHLTDSDIKRGHNFAFHTAYGGGYLHVVQWLHKTYKLLYEDIASGSWTLSEAADNRNVQIVQWLCVTYKQPYPTRIDQRWGRKTHGTWYYAPHVVALASCVSPELLTDMLCRL